MKNISMTYFNLITRFQNQDSIPLVALMEAYPSALNTAFHLNFCFRTVDGFFPVL
jgi:hypothetical protein